MLVMEGLVDSALDMESLRVERGNGSPRGFAPRDDAVTATRTSQARSS